MMDRNQQTTGSSSAPASNHTACSTTPTRGDSRSAAACAAAAIGSPSAAPKAPSRTAAPDRNRAPAASTPSASRRHRQPPPPPPAASQQPQRRVTVQHRSAAHPQRAPRPAPAGTRSNTAWWNRSIGPPRSASQRMIGVAGKPPTAASAARRRPQTRALSRQPPRHRRKPRNRLMLKHRTRRQHQPGPPRPAHQLDRNNAVAAQRKEVVVEPDPLKPQHLRKQPAQDLLLRRARDPAPRRNQSLRRRQRTTVELAVRRQRQTIQHHDRSRHQLLRQPLRQPSPQQKRPHRSSPQRRGGREIADLTCSSIRSRRRNHVANAAAPSRPRSRSHHNSLRNTSLPKQRSLDLARLDPDSPRSLICASVRPQNSRTPSSRQRAKVAAAVHPRTRSPIRVRNKPLRTSDPHAPDSPAPTPDPAM